MSMLDYESLIAGAEVTVGLQLSQGKSEGKWSTLCLNEKS